MKAGSVVKMKWKICSLRENPWSCLVQINFVLFAVVILNA